MTTRINPSILAADFANLERELGRIASADLVHVDIMDNHFVPNLTFGLPMVERLQQVSPIPLDVHLMIDDPDRWAPGYAEAGAASVTFHAEAAGEPVSLARRLREIGARAGIALKPGTDATPPKEFPMRRLALMAAVLVSSDVIAASIPSVLSGNWLRASSARACTKGSSVVWMLSPPR